MKFKLKSMPSDFIVSESLILPRYFGNHRAQFNYYFLEKCGYSTFDAIERIASLLNINTTDIGYAGLKDEDGITTQHVSISASLTSGIDFQKINETLFEGDKFIQLRYLAKGNKALSVGNLCGNTFYITVRNLPYEISNKIYRKKMHQVFLINYYGLQRFGLPNLKKNTHLIGQYLIKKDFFSALSLLKEQPSMQNKCAEYIKKPEEFFLQLDPRLNAFYQNSNYSYIWNKSVMDCLNEFCGKCIEENEEEIMYLYPLEKSVKIELLQSYPELKYPKIKIENNKLLKTKSSRQTVISSIVYPQRILPDKFNKNAYSCELLFNLPTGCYATVFVKQFIDEIVNL